MEITLLRKFSLDDALDHLQAEVEGLSRRQVAAFFAICGEALFPLYMQFVSVTGWGDPDVLRTGGLFALEFATGGEAMSASNLLEAIAKVTPDGERFDAPESTFAQDVAICMDAAVRAATLEEKINPSWVEYALEPSIIVASEEQTGYIDPGSSIEADKWRVIALRHPGLLRAFETAFALLAILKANATPNSSDIVRLRLLAVGLLVDSDRAPM